jgi:membrane dipeptidase
MPDTTHAAELHRRAFVIDGHSDILVALADGRTRLNERLNIEPPETWQGAEYARAAMMATPYQLSPYSLWFGCLGQYDIPRFQEGGVTAQVMAIYLEEHHLGAPLQRALDMVAVFHREIEANPDTVLLATTAADVRRAKAEGKTALILSFEGGEPLERDPNLIEIFYRLGLRMVSLTHSRRNFLADGTQMNINTGGLTDFGRQMIRRMNELGILIDLAHLADPGVWEILDLSEAPVILTHTQVRAGSPGYKAGVLEVEPRRGVTKLQAIARAGGLMGVIFWSQADIDTVVDELDAAIQHVGDDYVALGSDFYSQERAPRGMEDISKLPALTERMVQRGFSDDTILKILGGNYMRVFEQVLK